ncbi:nwd1 protein [Colletotrichum plurivorum]|uniref:Nwd1 protein n=1 Tax=Colletotrichum plurivorum TaxID=2175906 RepID=A0A8H6JXJ7_9PEZI|nr:nwd1 protein [Colletotrichum plurivorum]
MFACLSVLSDNATTLLAMSDGDVVQVWDVEEDVEIQRFNIPGRMLTQPTFVNDNMLIIVAHSIYGDLPTTVELWDWATNGSDCKGSLNVQGRVLDVGFSETRQQVFTESGAFNLSRLTMSSDSTSPTGPIFEEWDRRGYTVDKSGWVLKDAEKLLWLPPDYRPDSFASIAVNAPLIALGCNGNRLIVLEFKPV